MDPRLADYYRDELVHIRDAAAEFARDHKKMARRLALDPASPQGECPDPYVERLLEGFAFLAARVHYQQDAEYAHFTQHLLELIYPGFLAPTPSMMIAHLEVELDDPALAAGPEVKRGSLMSSRLQPGDRTACRFATGHAVRLWPLSVVQARFQAHVTDVPAAALAQAETATACLRLRLRVTAALLARQLELDELVLHLAGDEGHAHKIYEQLFARCLAVAVVDPLRRQALAGVLPASALVPGGLEDDEALLPVPPRSLGGYRLLKEYAAFPRRFLFARLRGLRRLLAQLSGNEIELLFITDRTDATLERSLDAANFALHCTPAINLFPKRGDRVEVRLGAREFHVVSDGQRSMDFEVHSLTKVTGIDATGVNPVREFRPLYARYDDAQGDAYAYYATHRIQRVPSEQQRLRGPRSSYLGTELYVTLADPQSAPWPVEVEQLAVMMLSTNRDLPLTLSTGSPQDFTLDDNTPVKGVRCLSGPSKPIAPVPVGRVPWRALSHLSLNHLSLTDSVRGGAAALREMLSLYGLDELSPLHKQLEGLVSVEGEQAISRVPVKGPIAFGRGTRVRLTMDERAFEPAGILVLATVLDRFFARQASLNSFVQLAAVSHTRGPVKTFAPRIGARAVL